MRPKVFDHQDTKDTKQAGRKRAPRITQVAGGY